MPINLTESEQNIADLQQAVLILTEQMNNMASRSVVVATVTRPLDTDFIVNPARPSFVMYTVELYVPTTLLIGVSQATVSLTVDGLTTHTAGTNLTAALSIGVAVSNREQVVLGTFVPANSTVNLTTTIVRGGTATYVFGQEILF